MGIASNRLRAGMVGMGMIFDETYRPFFEPAREAGIFDKRFGHVEVELAAVGSRTGSRAEKYRSTAPPSMQEFHNCVGENAIDDLLTTDVDFVCVATPDDRHFEIAKRVLEAGKHLIVEKPSVLSISELDELVSIANEKQVLAKVVYHKLLDPDHKKLRTLVQQDVLQHVNNGYCTLLEPKSISGSQFAEWITGRNPSTYVACHYIKLIDFTFSGKLKTITAHGQRGLVGSHDGTTWDSVQMKMVYEYESGREAAFDIHTSWVTPDNFPGYVEQEVQFRFDNGLWNGHSRKRGVECTVEEKTPLVMKNSMNNHYNGSFIEPWGENSQRGYGIEVIERFVREVATVEFGQEGTKDERFQQMNSLDYNNLSADRQVVAAVHAVEAILEKAAAGEPNCIVNYGDDGSLNLFNPNSLQSETLSSGK